MEIINYSGKKSYNSSGIRKNVFRKETNRPRYASSAIVAPRNYGVRNFLIMLRDAALLLLKIIFHIVEVAWIVPAIIACVYFQKKSVDEYADEKGFATPVEVCADNSWAIEFLDTAMSSFAMETTPVIDGWGNVVDENGNPYMPKVDYMQPVWYRTATFKSGDNISSFCKRNGLANISTVISINGIKDVTDIPAGKKLKIPNTDGIIYTVVNGDTLERLARRYSITVNNLLDVNNLASSVLSKGQELFIPGGTLSASELERAMGERFRNPLKAKYYLTSRFGRRVDPISGRKNSMHTGIDMACPMGTPVYASMSGTVEVAGWHNSYGNYVIISHKDHYQTLYGHMSKILTTKGTKVSQGDKIGLVGSTGYSTGPHLHFTVYKNGNLVDPLSLIK